MAIGPSQHYRGDIDGLRAVAIAGVVLFHFGLGPFPGGYAGVDVFLVISGFLIAGLLDSANRRGRFSLADFFERRARRIVPALFLVLLCCDLAAVRLLPNDMKSVGAGLMNAATFTSNFFLSSLAQNYFSANTLANQPELHTWSVSLEAQFYVLFALVFAATRRNGLRQKAAFATLALVSLAASIVGSALWPAQAFYLLPARLWEFLAGAFLYAAAQAGAGKALSERPRLAACVASAGLAAIILAYVAFSPHTQFPGIAAALPCLGAMALISAGFRRNFVSDALGSRVLAHIGRLSYSLYLWHWPLLVFASYGRAEPLTAPQKLALLAATFVLAAATRALVERPFIERRLAPTARAIGAACGAAGVAVLAGALVINFAGQKIISISILPRDVLALSDGQFDAFDRTCGQADLDSPPCRFGLVGAGAPEPTVLLWGNSFARMWLPALDAAAKRQGLAGQSFLLTRCPPLLDQPLAKVRGCADFNREVVAFLDAHPAIATIVLGGDWRAWRDELALLDRTIGRLDHGGARRIVFVMTPPPALYEVPRTLALAKLHGAEAPLLSRAAAIDIRRDEIAALNVARRTQDFTVVDPLDALCGAADCQVQRDGVPLYHDQEHISRYGANLFSGLFDAALRGDDVPAEGRRSASRDCRIDCEPRDKTP